MAPQKGKEEVEMEMELDSSPEPEVPPRQVKQHIEDRRTAGADVLPPDADAGGTTETALEVHGGEGGQESLPVLEAFRDFLDQERVRAQRRQTRLTVFFSCLLLLVLVGGSLVAQRVISGIKKDMAGVEAELRENSDQVRSDTDRALKALNSQALSLQTQLNLERRGLSSIQSNLMSRADIHGDRIDNVTNMLASLEMENSMLRRDLARIKDGMPAISKEMQGLLERITQLQQAKAREPAPRAVSPPPSVAETRPRPTPTPVVAAADTTTRPPESPSRLELRIRTPDGKRVVRWQLPIPE